MPGAAPETAPKNCSWERAPLAAGIVPVACVANITKAEAWVLLLETRCASPLPPPSPMGPTWFWVLQVTASSSNLETGGFG